MIKTTVTSDQSVSTSSTAFPKRTVRSFVRRIGRMTSAQRNAFELHWADYGLDSGNDPLCFEQIFDREAPVWFEIGFGNGDTLIKIASAKPEINFIGIDVHRPGAGRLLHNIAERDLTNVRVICDDAIDVLQQRVTANTLARVLLFFPDPWPKTKHQKRRIVSPEFATLIAEKLNSNGKLHMATDWKAYAEYMRVTLDLSATFKNEASDGTGFVSKPSYRPETHFERRGTKLGHGVWDLVYSKE